MSEIEPVIKKTLKEFEANSSKTYDELVTIYKEQLSKVPAAVKDKPKRALFKVKQSLRGRAGVSSINIEGAVLGATITIDIAGGRRFKTINVVKDYMEKSQDGNIDKMVGEGLIEIVPYDVHQAGIDAKLAEIVPNMPDDKKEPIEAVVNILRRQAEDGIATQAGAKYVVLPLETRQFFDKAGKRKNPNFGKPMNYADRRRFYLIGRTVVAIKAGKETAYEFGTPKLLVIEARLDQCYNWTAEDWSAISGFNIRVREDKDDVMYLSTTKNTEWKPGVKDSFLESIGVASLEDDDARVQLLLSAPDQFQTTIDEIWKMYSVKGQKDWNEMMSNWDRFHIIVADLLNKSDIGLGFREEFLGEGTEPESMDYDSKSMNFWIDPSKEDAWNQFGNASRIVFAGMLQSRRIWDSDAAKMSDEEAPCMASVNFIAIPEYREEPN